MIGKYFSLNGELKPLKDAVVSVDNLAFVYGYGVYETLKVRHGLLYFPKLHAERLLLSAKTIGLSHEYSLASIVKILNSFVGSVGEESFNLKMLLMGGSGKHDPDLYVFALAPKYVSDKEYRDGVAVVTYDGERIFPQAKTLNMLMSFIAYRKAHESKAHDALLVDNLGCIREGTRTNFFFTDGKTIFTPPRAHVLEGVTKITLTEALGRDIKIQERELKLSDVGKYKGFFLTSTSAKVLPISSIDGKMFEIPSIVRETMKLYDEYLENYRQKNK